MKSQDYDVRSLFPGSFFKDFFPHDFLVPKELSFCHKLKFLIHITMQSDGVNF